LPASDMKFFSAGFTAYVKKATAGSNEFVKGSIDNVVLKYKEDGITEKIYTQNFDGYSDGKKPKKDTIFNEIYAGSRL
jgi:hypothetical protein